MKVEIIFIPTAGGVTIPFRYGKELPWWLQIPPLKKWIRSLAGVHTYQLPILKLETIARCKVGAFLLRQDDGGVVKVAFLSGGASKRMPSNVELMEFELHRNGALPDEVVLDAHPVQTTEKAKDLVKFVFCLSENIGKDMEIGITAVVSWYCSFRVRWEIRRWLKKYGLPVPVKCFKVFPPLKWECLKREYLYNILFEPIKIIRSFSPAFLRWFGKSERKTRGIQAK